MLTRPIIVLTLFTAMIIGLSFWLVNTYQSRTHQNDYVSWEMTKDGTYAVREGEALDCPEPLILTTPVDITKLAGILYPGQVRGPEFKVHGAFRFKEGFAHDSVVRVPFDAYVKRGHHFISNGEDQYAFEFQSPCGIAYHFGHLRVLSPKFAEIIANLPPPDENSQYASLLKPIKVTIGEVVATEVGYANDLNVFVDWGVRDLRQKNSVTLRSEWSQFSDQLDQYAICWLDYIPPDDSETLRALHSTGDHEWGNKSDFCSYPDNR